MSNSESNLRSEGGKVDYEGGGNSSSSPFSGPDFNTLYLQKRSTDSESIKRRESITEQYKAGFVAKMWRR
ncbi:uncharacterized protein F4812DRAFT_456188 [Daldinia caldariorum]|uniref:uncharacterized protein n=1 Tax=Daldinia caldariorum TaxID=326644 RepID=UPI002007EEAA|nr:uncharacterized protein F4812DRAFT_456188 [Daldinia caldariorum]KAI1472092.1 hypothetical protein F4812DRAFT_456188 [Daldinia caldariorum]